MGQSIIYLSQKYPKSRITSLSNSQKSYIDAIAKESGLSNVEFCSMSRTDAYLRQTHCEWIITAGPTEFKSIALTALCSSKWQCLLATFSWFVFSIVLSSSISHLYPSRQTFSQIWSSSEGQNYSVHSKHGSRNRVMMLKPASKKPRQTVRKAFYRLLFRVFYMTCPELFALYGGEERV
ncbi:hypothetical protein CY34DRAFT_370366 [Suillus luteus UH-Slu-Lm8-n1]|uniref:Uncharacterized protein n=1 Tax=Suillus luteus UH-Slu-Lm8-n1 TaxID=930992 RepID=A0A0D0AYJ6_9AGAM|nr:hypothetical protein CY34DRAFT_370366 [Suillus luteus UH-Slu-Lm8-n1]